MGPGSPSDFRHKKPPLAASILTISLIEGGLFNHDDAKSKLKWLLKYIAWGDLAIPLEPHPTNKMYGRNAFMIHGGGWIMGSKGCVYVYSKSADVYKALKQHPGNVELIVKY